MLRRGLLLIVAFGALVAPAGAASVRLPPANVPFDYQIGGAFLPADDVTIVDRDRTDRPAEGRYNVCYVNAFQTQPGEVRGWKRLHPDLLLRRRGRLVVDGAWNEVLLDTSTAGKRRRLAKIVGGWIDGCARAGYDAVEPDNLDSWTRSQGTLTKAQNRAFARLLVQRAHRAGLAIAQKDTAELLPDARRVGFDFSIAEECNVYDECDDYMAVYGRLVYAVEYSDDGGARSPAANYEDACRRWGTRISITYRDRLVQRPGTKGYRSVFC